MGKPVSQFFSVLVRPTCNDFFEHPMSIRFALLSAITLNHLIDYRAMEDYTGLRTRSAMYDRLQEVRARFKAKCPAVEIVEDIADVTKHSMLSVSPKRERAIISAEQVTRSGGIFREPFGTGVFNEGSYLYIEKVDLTRVPVLGPIREVFEMWESELSDPQFSQ